MDRKSTLILGNSLEELKNISSKSVQVCVTSPPYWGLRDYGVKGQLGLELTPAEYVENLVLLFREVKRVLKPNGTLWLNLGDTYNGSGKGRLGNGTYTAKLGEKQVTNRGSVAGTLQKTEVTGLKPKDLVGIPWKVAFALQADGWYLRQDIIWHKPNPMPESVRDRCTKAHEYIFLFSKSPKYYFDHESIKEPVSSSTKGRLKQDINNQAGSLRVPFKINGPMKAVGNSETRNKRSVWTVTTQPFKGAHFATFPPNLIKPCILAGSSVGDTVLDPFNGAGTTGLVALENNRSYIGIELNPAYLALTAERLKTLGKKYGTAG